MYQTTDNYKEEGENVLIFYCKLTKTVQYYMESSLYTMGLCVYLNAYNVACQSDK